MGNVHQKMSDWKSALRFHQLDKQISEECGDVRGQARSLSNLGETYEAMEKADKAMECFEAFLRIASETGDCGLKTKAYGNLGKKED